MQRIDENTYIDETLVTCAEYQLFIDEMREQGRFYQPDHWTSYKFPEGQAREPILGARYSDAVKFCEWLTKRDNGEWNFRLPSPEEVGEYPVNSNVQLPLGYWTITNEKKIQIAWVKSTNTGSVGHNLTRYLDLEQSFDSACLSLKNLSRDLGQEIILHFSVLRLTNPSDRTSRISDNVDLVNNLSRAVANDFASFTTNTQRQTIGKTKEDILNLLVDLSTLQERIARRSPAFEGIRLVKERIR